MTTLYRIYGRVDGRDKNGLGPVGKRLLYVGITDDFDTRMRTHSEKRWWEAVTKITREEFSDRGEAARAEAAAIRSEQPIHNRAMNPARPNGEQQPSIPKPTKHKVADRPLSLAAAADYLGVSERTLRRYIAAGDLPAVRIRGSRLIRIRASALDDLLQPILSAKEGD